MQFIEPWIYKAYLKVNLSYHKIALYRIIKYHLHSFKLLHIFTNVLLCVFFYFLILINIKVSVNLSDSSFPINLVMNIIQIDT